MSQVIYDIETYPNYFCIGFEHCFSDYKAFFECSEYRDDSEAMFGLLGLLAREQVELVGFNNINFDWPIMQHLIRTCFDERGEHQTRHGAAVAQAAYQKAEMIIQSQNRFAHQIWQSDRFIPQVDLYKINHFDNMAKSTSLKVLQFAMRAPSVETLPIAPGTKLTAEQARKTGEYCMHDIAETKRFWRFNAEAIAFRRQMADKLDGDVMNWSDVKIGSELMIQRLGKKLCYTYDSGSREPRKTKRASIPLAEVIFPYIKFDRPECKALLDRFRAVVVTNTRASVSDAIELNGFTFAYGTGGVHGSADKRAFHATPDMRIIDADVTSLYPNIAVQNELYPEHLGNTFGRVYKQILDERQRHAKGTADNAALKLAANGTYGNSNNEYSPMYDPQFTMAITINGQLLLTMFAERLLDAVPGLEIIQINTDGITCCVPEASVALYNAVCDVWQRDTRLVLEFAEYKSFWCRDVNNYLAVTTSGKVKRKGAYDFPTPDLPIGTAPSGPRAWHGDQSFMVVQAAVDANLTRGVPLEIFVRDHRDPFDFMGRYKTPRSSKLLLGGVEQQSVTRYYRARPDRGGLPLVKQSPPPDHSYANPGAYKRKSNLTDAEFFKVYNTLPAGPWDARIHTANKSTYGDREMTVASAARIANVATDFDWSAVDYEWYVAEAAKLVDCFASA